CEGRNPSSSSTPGNRLSTNSRSSYSGSSCCPSLASDAQRSQTTLPGRPVYSLPLYSPTQHTSQRLTRAPSSVHTENRHPWGSVPTPAHGYFPTSMSKMAPQMTLSVAVLAVVSGLIEKTNSLLSRAVIIGAELGTLV